MTFYESVLEKDSEMYESFKKNELDYKIGKTRRNTMARNRHSQNQRKLRTATSFAIIIFMVATFSILSFNVFANEQESKYCEIGQDTVVEFNEQIILNSIIGKHQDYLAYIEEKERIEANVKTQMKEYVVSRGAELKREKVDLTQSEYMNKKIEYVKSVNLEVARVDVPMPVEHQEYLYLLCEEKGLDFTKTLASIKHESAFNPDATGRNYNKLGELTSYDYGYMQINSGNRKSLSRITNLPDSPLNPYVNMEWGTYMLADLYATFKSKGYVGEDLDHRVWSAYNMGMGGYNKYGIRWIYVEKMYEAYNSLL